MHFVSITISGENGLNAEGAVFDEPKSPSDARMTLQDWKNWRDHPLIFSFLYIFDFESEYLQLHPRVSP